MWSALSTRIGSRLSARPRADRDVIEARDCQVRVGEEELPRGGIGEAGEELHDAGREIGAGTLMEVDEGSREVRPRHIVEGGLAGGKQTGGLANRQAPGGKRPAEAPPRGVFS